MPKPARANEPKPPELVRPAGKRLTKGTRIEVAQKAVRYLMSEIRRDQNQISNAQSRIQAKQREIKHHLQTIEELKG